MIADAIMASILLVSRYLITTRIVTFPIFQLAATAFYLLLSCFGIFQIFSVASSAFILILITFVVVGELWLIPSLLDLFPDRHDIEFNVHSYFGNSDL